MDEIFCDKLRWYLNTVYSLPVSCAPRKWRHIIAMAACVRQVVVGFGIRKCTTRVILLSKVRRGGLHLKSLSSFNPLDSRSCAQLNIECPLGRSGYQSVESWQACPSSHKHFSVRASFNVQRSTVIDRDNQHSAGNLRHTPRHRCGLTVD